MPDGSSTGMDTDATRELGLQFKDFSDELDEVRSAAAMDGPGHWAPEHFGGLESAQKAARTLVEVLTSLGNSVGYVATMADAISGALTGVATSTEDVDAGNAQTMNTAGGQ